MGRKEIETLVLGELYKNALISTNIMARHLSSSRQLITNVRNGLISQEIIHSPSILLNPNRLLSYHYFIKITCDPTNQQLLTIRNKFPEIYTFDLLLGENSLLLKGFFFIRETFSEIINYFNQLITNGTMISFQVIQPVIFYKLGGFIFPTNFDIFPLTSNQLTALTSLVKNPNPFDHNLKEIRNYLHRERIIHAFPLFFKKAAGDFGYKYYIEIKLKRFDKLHLMINHLQNTPNVIDICQIAGDFDLFLTFRAKLVSELRSFIFSLYEGGHIATTLSTLVMQEIIPNLHPPSVQVAIDLIQSI